MNNTPIPVCEPPSNETRLAIKRLGEHVSALQVSLPISKEGLPLSYIDPQVLLESGFLEDELNMETMDKAVVPIDYADGYPVVDGLPIWDRLGGELLDYYNLFKSYRDQKLKQAVRSLGVVAKQANVPVDYVAGISKAFHWRARVKAFDLYMEAEREAERTRSMILLEGKHRQAAEDIFAVCMDFIRNDDVKDRLSPKTALAWLEAAIKLGRISLGLPPDKPVGSIESTGSTNIQAIINQMPSQDKPDQPRSRKQTVAWLQEVLDTLIEAGQFRRILDAEVIEVKSEQSNSSGDEPGTSLPATDSPDSKDDKVHPSQA